MKIQILMSTYNGSRYLRTQLDSIAAQTVRDRTLFIRDDGSQDDTPQILREYQLRYPWISYECGENIGVQRSFLELIGKADRGADYIAFSDQDDEWLAQKLERAVECLAAIGAVRDLPLLYCSDKQVVGKNLEDIPVTVSRPVRRLSFGNALVQNICTGCTAVINQPLAELVQTHLPQHPAAVIMHDWWLYLTASCFGQVYYDKNAYIRYRQHGNNASGAMRNHRELWRYRLGQLSKPRGDIYRQAGEFLESFGSLLMETPGYAGRLKEIETLLSAGTCFGDRLRLCFDKRYFRQKWSDDLVFRIIVLIGRL